MNYKKCLAFILVSSTMLFAFSGCSIVLIGLGLGSILNKNEATEPGEPSVPEDSTDPSVRFYPEDEPLTADTPNLLRTMYTFVGQPVVLYS